LPWERLLWHGRSHLLSLRSERYTLTDFRLVRESRGSQDEIALDDIGDITREERGIDRFIGTSTISVHDRSGRGTTVVLRHLARGAALAAVLELLSNRSDASIAVDAVNAALAWRPPRTFPRFGQALVSVALVVTTMVGITIALHGHDARPAVFGPDDPIA